MELVVVWLTMREVSAESMMLQVVRCCKVSAEVILVLYSALLPFHKRILAFCVCAAAWAYQ